MLGKALRVSTTARFWVCAGLLIGGAAPATRAEPPAQTANQTPAAAAPSRWRQRSFLDVVSGLDLSREQRARIKPIVAAWRTGRATVPAESAQQRWALTAQMQNEVSGVLTRAQQATLRAELEKSRLAGGILDNVLQPLALTDAQKDRAEPILLALGRELGRIKGSRLSEPERGRQARAAFQTTLAQLRPLLTAAQKVRLARFPWVLALDEGNSANS